MWLELKKSSFRAFATRANKGSGRGIYNIKFARIAQYILVLLRVAVFAPVDLKTLRRLWKSLYGMYVWNESPQLYATLFKPM